MRQKSHDATAAPARSRRHSRSTLALVFGVLGLTLFAAGVQAGFFLPQFSDTGETATGTTGRDAWYVETVTNSTWRSWTVLGVRLSNGKPSATLPAVGPASVGLQVNVDLSSNNPIRPVPEVVVPPGGTFSVTLALTDCDPPVSGVWVRQRRGGALVGVDIPVSFLVRTPFGTRSVGESFSVSCM
jgi:hypothetical protein